MNTPLTVAQAQITPSNRLPALALASVLTLAMLLGVNSLARVDTPAPQLAQATQAHA